MPGSETMYLMGGFIDNERSRTVSRFSDGSWNDGPRYLLAEKLHVCYSLVIRYFLSSELGVLLF